MRLADCSTRLKTQASTMPFQGWFKPPASPVVLTLFFQKVTFTAAILYASIGNICSKIADFPDEYPKTLSTLSGFMLKTFPKERASIILMKKPEHPNGNMTERLHSNQLTSKTLQEFSTILPLDFQKHSGLH